jgi:hypothetical protein
VTHVLEEFEEWESLLFIGKSYEICEQINVSKVTFLYLLPVGINHLLDILG